MVFADGNLWFFREQNNSRKMFRQDHFLKLKIKVGRFEMFVRFVRMKTFKPPHFLIYMAFLMICGICFSQSRIEKAHQKTQKLAEKFLSKSHIPGMSVSVNINDTLVFSEGFGFSDLENKTAVMPSQTRFRMASITKTMTAATLAKLSELNKVDLKKSVYFYLDSLPKKPFDFTIEEVGGHLSGLQRTASTEKYTCDNPYKRSDFYKIFDLDPLSFQPSSSFQYSNYGYKLLGLVIEKITGESVVENNKKYIIDAIGLKNTVPETKIKDPFVSKFYTELRDKFVEAPCLDCTFRYAPGCYLSTSEDLVVLGNAYLYPDRILKKETLIQIIKSKKLRNGPKTNYGFGFMTYTDGNGNYFYGHNGGYEGSRSALRIYPKNKMVIAVLTNCTVENIDDFIAEIAYNYIADK